MTLIRIDKRTTVMLTTQRLESTPFVLLQLWQPELLSNGLELMPKNICEGPEHCAGMGRCA